MASKSKEPVSSRLSRISRDTIIFAFGLAGLLHETVVKEVERPFLLGLFATMIGLPAFLRMDERKKDEGK